MTPYNNPHLTYLEQIELLRNRGLIISDTLDFKTELKNLCDRYPHDGISSEHGVIRMIFYVLESLHVTNNKAQMLDISCYRSVLWS
jgi:hypothetical protein